MAPGLKAFSDPYICLIIRFIYSQVPASPSPKHKIGKTKIIKVSLMSFHLVLMCVRDSSNVNLTK